MSTSSATVGKEKRTLLTTPINMPSIGIANAHLGELREHILQESRSEVRQVYLMAHPEEG